MNRLAFLLALAIAMLLSGCVAMTARVTAPKMKEIIAELAIRSEVNALLDAVLPPDFNGPIEAQIFAPLNVQLSAENVRKNGDNWTYTYLKLSGGMPSPNVITLGKPGIVIPQTTGSPGAFKR